MRAYAYITKELYDEVLEKGRVYPKSGYSCFATYNGVYKAYERRYGQEPFFAWDKPTDTFIEEEGDWVYVELELPKEITKVTNYLNWSDLILLYKDDNFEPDQDIINQRLDCYGFDIMQSLDEFWNDIFAIDENDRNQVLYDYLDVSFIKRAATKAEDLRTY